MRLSQGAFFLAWTSFLSITTEGAAARFEREGLCQNETRQQRKDESAKDPLLEVQAWFDTTKRFAVIRVTVCGKTGKEEPLCFVSSITGVIQDNYINDEMLRKNLLSTFQGDGKIVPIDQVTQQGQLTARQKKRKILKNISSGSHVIYKLCKEAQVYLFISEEKPTVTPTRKRRHDKEPNNKIKDFITKCFKQRNDSCTRICVGQNTLSGKDAMKCKKFRIQCLFQCRIPISTEINNLKGPNPTDPSGEK